MGLPRGRQALRDHSLHFSVAIARLFQEFHQVVATCDGGFFIEPSGELHVLGPILVRMLSKRLIVEPPGEARKIDKLAPDFFGLECRRSCPTHQFADILIRYADLNYTVWCRIANHG